MDPTAAPPPVDAAFKPDFSYVEQFRRHIDVALHSVGKRLLLVAGCAAVLQMGTLALEFAIPWQQRVGRMGTSASVLMLCLVCGLLARRWGLRAAMCVFCLLANCMLLGAAYIYGIGVHSSGIPGVLLITLTAAFLAGRRLMWTVTLMAATGITLLGVAQDVGWITGPTAANTPPVGSFVVVYLTVLMLCAWLVTRFSAIFWHATSSLQSSHELLLQSMRSQQDSSDELRRSEQRLRRLLDGALFGIQIIEADTAAVRYANDQALTLFGCTQLSELDTALLGLDRPGDREEFLGRVRGAAQGRVQVFSWQARRRDGTALWLDLKLDRVEFYGEMQVVMFIHDVTARAMAEAELRQHRELLQEEVAARTAEQKSERQKMQEIIEALPITLSVRSPAGRFMMVNRYFEEAVGRPRDAVLGRAMKDLFDAGYAAAAKERDETVLSTGHSVTVEEQVRHPGGDQRDYLTTTVPLTDQRGKPYATLHLGTDVTVLKTLQRELSTARDEAQASAQAKGYFLANMSHEIRTPLNAMLGLAQLGRRNGAQHPPAVQAFERILRAGRHLQGVINDVLDYTRIESGKLPVERQPVRLAAVVKDAMDLVSDRAVEKGLALKWSSDGVPTHVKLDPLRVSQVLVNLLANAIKFTEHGAVTLFLQRQGEQLSIAVSDTGPGIPPEDHERIFHAFEQADASTTRKYGGSGLGLAISRRQVEAMGGTLSVRSTPGQGATFTVLLPLEEVEAPASTPGDGVQARDLSGLQVLVVDDVDINREILQDILAHFGVASMQAASGEEAIRLVEAHGAQAFDLVLMDVQMPHMDGYQTAAALRQLDPELPMVAVTAHAMASHRQHSMDAGMKDHLNKPVDADALMACVARVVPEARARRPAASPGPGQAPRTPTPAPEDVSAAAQSQPSQPSPTSHQFTAQSTAQSAVQSAVQSALPPAPAAPPPEDAWPDLPDADFPAALHRCAGQRPLLLKLLRQFSRHYAAHRDLFAAAQADGQAVLQSAAHRLKGAATNLGMAGLAAEAHALERACAEPGAELSVPAALGRLTSALDVHLQALERWLPADAADASK